MYQFIKNEDNYETKHSPWHHNYGIVDNINWDYLNTLKNYKYRTY